MGSGPTPGDRPRLWAGADHGVAAPRGWRPTAVDVTMPWLQGTEQIYAVVTCQVWLRPPAPADATRHRAATHLARHAPLPNPGGGEGWLRYADAATLYVTDLRLDLDTGAGDWMTVPYGWVERYQATAVHLDLTLRGGEPLRLVAPGADHLGRLVGHLAETWRASARGEPGRSVG